jgi:hypothetical protein
MDTKELIKQIIPPARYEYREGFSNHEIIDGLNDLDRTSIENELIHLLQISEEPDILMIETLGYMKSKKSLNLLNTLVKKQLPVIDILSIVSVIYEIDKDVSMIDIAIQNFEKLTDNTDLFTAFYYLFKLNNERTDNVIRKYLDHKDYYVSYHAKRFMDLRANPNMD